MLYIYIYICIYSLNCGNFTVCTMDVQWKFWVGIRRSLNILDLLIELVDAINLLQFIDICVHFLSKWDPPLAHVDPIDWDQA